FTAPAYACLYTLSLHDALPISSGYPLGYVLGAVAADGSIQQGRRINLTVKRAEFAEKYRAMFADAFPGSEPAIERVTVPSSFLRSEEHTSELQSRFDLVCRLLL